MRKTILPLLFMLCASASAYAQTFLDNLQKTNNGGGKVTVTQSKDIDNLVNGQNGQKPQTPTQQKPATAKANADKPKDAASAAPHKDAATTAPHKDAAAKDKTHTANAKTNSERANVPENKNDRPKNERQTDRPADDNAETGTPAVDMTKKVMRGSRKVSGYRVQAFAGGNTRDDKMRAQQIGNAIKMKHPDQPVYVHFYSPRWICRVGNYRTYGEAQKMLKSIKEMGYKSATIVKGTITVQN